MPTQINGIGTTYLGRQNLEQREGVCEFCDRPVVLESYETRLWFTVIFLPILPLGRKQILDSCSACRRHRALPVEEWKQLKRNVIDENTQQWTERKDDPKAAVNLHASLSSFGKTVEAEKLALAMTSSFSDDVDVQLYLGSWYEQKGESEEADRCFDRALEIDPDNPAARHAVGVGKIQQGKLAEARDLLRPLEPPAEDFSPAAFYLLAKGYQAEHNHDAALEVFQIILKGAPDATNDKTFRQALRESEAALGREQSLIASDPIYRSKPFVSAAIALVVIAALVIWNLSIAGRRTLHVVNGLPVSIEVEIDGQQKVVVGASLFMTASLGEGPHTARVIKPSDLVEPVEFRMETSWFSRFFAKPVFVLDPARSAVVCWEEAVYSERPNQDGGDIKVSMGQSYAFYDDVDYVFEDFPHEIRVENDKTTSKTRVAMYTENPLDVLMDERCSLNGDEKLQFLETRLVTAPGDQHIFGVYAYLAQRDNALPRAVSFLESRLNQRPVSVEWHRTYQTIRELTGNFDDLVASYDKMLAADPDNSRLLYLRGRLEPLMDKAIAFYERAIVADESNSYAWSAKAWHLLTAGEFAAGIIACDKSLAIRTDRVDVDMTRRALLLAMKQYNSIEQELNQVVKDEPLNVSAAVLMAKVLTLQGRDDEASKVKADLVAAARSRSADPAQVAQLAARCDLALQIGRASCRERV